MNRRRLFQLAFGASQVGLLSRYGLLDRAYARDMSDYPSKFLSIWVDGGLHWESFFAPFTRAGIEKYMPAPTGGNIPWGYQPDQVMNFDKTMPDLEDPSVIRRLRGPIYWNWDDPGDRTGKIPEADLAQIYRPYGYAWADPTYKLYEKATLLVGADQGTASHQSGRIAGMCGVAGANFQAPSINAVIATALASRFPDRPIPNVTLGGTSPTALDLPALARPTILRDVASIEATLSQRYDSAWAGLRHRDEIPNIGFDGSTHNGSVSASIVEQALLADIRKMHDEHNAGGEALLERLYDTYKSTSNAIARDVLTILEQTVGWEHLEQNTMYPKDWTGCIGRADACGPGSSMGPYDFALRLLKSDLVTSVNLRATSIQNFSFDTHSANGPQHGANHLRLALEQIGRLCLEMSLTPSSERAGKSLLDDTLVYVFSDFGRTFPKSGSDHHPATCALLVGGGITGNQMLGGYDERMSGSPLGAPVELTEETGEIVTRVPRAQDVAATVLTAFGLHGGEDFFIPGGFGHFNGVVPEHG